MISFTILSVRNSPLNIFLLNELENLKVHINQGGNYYKPISINLLEEVKNKLKIGKYKYQLN